VRFIHESTRSIKFIREADFYGIQVMIPGRNLWINDAMSNTRCTEALSVREMEVLIWFSRGKSADEIASKISCSKRTVKYHIGNIYRKLDAANRMQALQRALSLGLINIG
jgi:DNA-binding CsgD family transcriptional regulator